MGWGASNNGNSMTLETLKHDTKLSLFVWHRVGWERSYILTLLEGDVLIENYNALFDTTVETAGQGGVGGHFDTPGYRREGQKGNKRTKTRDRQRDMTHKGLLSQPVLTKIFGVEGNLCTITCIKHCQRHNRPKGWIFSSKWLRVLSWYHNFSSGSKSRPNFSLKKLTTIWLQHLNQTLAPMFGLCFNFKIMTKFQSQSLT